jgi:hypothetical protein
MALERRRAAARRARRGPGRCITCFARVEQDVCWIAAAEYAASWEPASATRASARVSARRLVAALAFAVAFSEPEGRQACCCTLPQAVSDLRQFVTTHSFKADSLILILLRVLETDQTCQRERHIPFWETGLIRRGDRSYPSRRQAHISHPGHDPEYDPAATEA